MSHAIVAAALAPLAPRGVPRTRLTLVLMALAVLPDLDVLGFAAGIPYRHPLGHRGATHSLAFAAVVACTAAGFCTREQPRFSRAWWAVAALAFLATASHGLLDAMTDAGLGTGFFLPFDETRHFFPWRPIVTSPLSPAAFFSSWGLRVLSNEALWIWLPVGLAVALGYAVRRAIR